jgi:predicted house-cleaning noncanonical NTP pyrophosphatase (MazG superfamily)
MRTFRQNKLWRDKLVAIVEQRDGSRIYWRRLEDKEFDKQLRIKLLEEAHEAVAAQERTELLAELADVYEVIDTLAELHKISKDEIIAAQIKKRDECGGFAGRMFVSIAEHPVGSFGEKYCLASPEKYPEIKS